MPLTVRFLAVAAALTAAVVVVGTLVTGGEESVAPPAPPEATSTPLADVDTTSLSVLREAFCDAVPEERVTETLGEASDGASSYDNGERARIDGSEPDVAHEFGCTWTAASGATARAWIFAPPVTRERARDLVRGAEAERGCRTVVAPELGSPSTALACRDGGRLEVSFRGLLGDAWLTCSLTVPGAGADLDDLVDRTGRWCVAITTASTSPQTASG